jgi:lipopolysaccharide exporter
MNQINNRMAIGMVWMVAARLFDRSIGIVSTLFLARLLVPGDFGLVAMATALGGMLDLLGSFSFDMALIQKKDAERRHYDTVWTFNVLFGLATSCGLLLLTQPAAAFYHEPRLEGVMQVLALSYAIGAFANAGVVSFRKDLQFRQEFLLIFWRRVATFIPTLVAAWILRSYWALLMGMVLGRLVNVILSYTMNAYRPRFSFAATRELFHFSKWMLLNNALAFLRHDGCTFMIGKIFGSSTLGIYALSYEISNLPSSELVAPINRVSFPGYAQLREPALIAKSYCKLLGMIALLIFPMGVGIAAVAEPLVLTLLGAQWREAIPLIAILAISGALTATQTNNGSVWLALGQPHKVTVTQASYVCILFPTLYLCVMRYGVVGAGYAYLLAQLADIAIEMRITQRMLNLVWYDAWYVIWRPAVGAAAMYGLVSVVDHALAGSMPLLRLVVDAVAGAAAYCMVVMVLWRLSACPEGAETFCLRRAKFIS